MLRGGQHRRCGAHGADSQDLGGGHRGGGQAADSGLDYGHHAQEHQGLGHPAHGGRRTGGDADRRLGRHRQRQGLCGQSDCRDPAEQAGQAGRFRRCGQRGLFVCHQGYGYEGAVPRQVPIISGEVAETSPTTTPPASRCPPSAAWACWSTPT